jgi:hypothetical protein
MPTLKDYSSVETAMLVKWVYDVPQFGGPPFATFTTRVSDSYRSITVDSDTYTPLGGFLNISPSSSDIRASDDSVAITFSGIRQTGTNNGDLLQILNKLTAKIPGSQITILRVFYEPGTGALLPLDINPIGRFYGFVNNFQINEVKDNVTGQGSTVLTLNASSYKAYLGNQIKGRTTSMGRGTEQHFRRVVALKGVNLNWGARS